MRLMLGERAALLPTCHLWILGAMRRKMRCDVA